MDKEEQSIEQSRALGTVRNSAFSLLRIIDDILDANKINSGELNIEAARVELRPVLEGVVVTLQTMADDNNVLLALAVSPKVPNQILADSGRLRQILLNLLSNSIKYTADDLTGRQGWVYLTADLDSQRTLVLSVRDEGIGMSEDLMNKIFQPFVQRDMTAIRKVSGTGLGLVITKQLIQQMNGKIETTSKEGIGTTITVTLPLPFLPQEKSDHDRYCGLKIIYIRDQSCISVWQQTDILTSMGADVIKTEICTTDKIDMPETGPGTVFLMHAKDPIRLRAWQKQIRNERKNPRMIVFTDIRSDKIGQIHKDLFNVQLYPILQSELYGALDGLVSISDFTPTAQRASFASETSETSELQKSMRKKVKLLLVEDNEINQVVLLKQLTILGYQAEVANNGSEGLEKWKTQDFDMILTDCNMPLMDGLEMTRLGRRWESKNNQNPVPIIAITANALTDDAQKCFEAGMNDYLAKPMEINTLEEKIVKIIGV